MYKTTGRVFNGLARRGGLCGSIRPWRIFERTRTTRWPNYPVGKAQSGLIKRLDNEAERVTILAKADYERQKPQSGLVKAGAKLPSDSNLSRC